LGVTSDQVARQLEKLLPRGAAWRGAATRYVYRLLQAAADELVRLYGREEDLRAEAHPISIDELLDEWELELGLPPPCVTEELTLEERIAAVSAKLAQTGGQSRQYYIDVAARLGIDITIEECTPFYVGTHGCGDAVGEIDWKFTWIVHAPLQGTTYFDVATGVVGDPLVASNSAVLDCMFQSIKPAHTVLVVHYDA
jgi:uncharacterized protein YmfQ (DUF2313 family)